MSRKLATPITVRRKGRVRVVNHVQTCWYTGALLVTQDHSKNGADRGKPELPNKWSLEHIVPAESHLIDVIPVDLRGKNTVPCAGAINSAIGNMPLGLKLVIRDRLRQTIHGTTDLRDVAPIEWTNEIRSLALRVIREEDSRFRLFGKRIHHDPVVVPSEGTRLWSVDNPHMKITPEILAERECLLAELRALTHAAFVGRFGIDTPEVTAAIEADLSRHVGPTGRNARAASQKLAES